ncbi:MAG TPA: hypothetical protein PKA63_01525 [Oligoflexia bacterium]|mgnify:CR=1 FL=1|nr:hypothetical protein [Oligoflexia bacterium]HMP47329.1 hypothetical protein [Oligoflexia bacterium]
MQSSPLSGTSPRANIATLANMAVTPSVTGIAETGNIRPLPFGGRGNSSSHESNLLFGGPRPSQIDGSYFSSGILPAQNGHIQQSYFDPGIRPELERINYFDLLSPSPSVNQLFKPNYIELVSNLVNIQNSYQQADTIDRTAKTLEGNLIFSDITLSGQNPIGNDTLGAIHLKSTTNSEIDPFLFAQSTDHVSQQGTPYNHLLHNNLAAKKHSSAERETTQRNQRQEPEQKAKPYFDRKKSKKEKGTNSANKNRGESTSGKIIKGILKGLDTISGVLAKYSD